mmetsp:Transcript_15654/g.28465  ORF Transcript_15654/g.28465 Transcript_15654/m.28465 type:complete len:266 (-) Transcript_15654:2378-3175(-)
MMRVYRDYTAQAAVVMVSACILVLAILEGGVANAFVPMTDAPQNRFYKTSSPMLVSEGSSRLYSIDQGCSSIDENEMSDLSLVGRRSALMKSASLFGTVAAALTCQSEQAWAAPASNQADQDKIIKGYNRLTYLLDNWEKETTICGRTDNPYIGCERTPEKVMEYLGYKSMNDPLFRADKTLIRLQGLVPSNDSKAQADYQDAVDSWMEKAEEGNGMAYISSWGESNPGGGKDRVALFIERSRKDVVECRDSLATIIRILDLKVN